MDASVPLYLQKVLAIIPMVSGSLSVLGSVAIISIILRSHIRLSSTYHRILFCLSICEICRASTLAASTLPVPKDTQVVMSFGNQTTCDVQGFIHVFSVASTLLYFCGLSTYFLLAIKVGVSNEAMAKRFEPIVHGVSLLYSLSIAIFVQIHSGFHTSGNICWIAPEPMNCIEDPSIDCGRGSDSAIVTFLTIGWLMFFTFVLTATNMMIIFCNLLHVKRSSRVSLGTRTAMNQNDNAAELQCLNPASSQRLRRQSSLADLYEKSRRQKKRLSKSERERKEGMIQCLLYIGAFFVSYFFVILCVAMQRHGVSVPIGLSIWTKFIYPLLGCLYFIIFIRPTFNKTRKRHPSYSKMKALIAAMKSRGETRRDLNRRESLRKKFSQQLKRASLRAAAQAEVSCDGSSRRRQSILDTEVVENQEAMVSPSSESFASTDPHRLASVVTNLNEDRFADMEVSQVKVQDGLLLEADMTLHHDIESSNTNTDDEPEALELCSQETSLNLVEASSTTENQV